MTGRAVFNDSSFLLLIFIEHEYFVTWMFIQAMSQVLKSHCNSCRQETNQNVLFEHVVIDEQPGIEHIFKDKYMVIQCLGCEAVSYLTEDKYTSAPQLPEEDWMVNLTSYPKSIYDNSDFTIFDYEKYDQFPNVVRDLYMEIESALKSESLILAALGLRTLVEAICIEQGMEGYSLADKIKSMESRGLISRNERPILDKLRKLGNASAHEIKKFSTEQLSYALDIVNHVLTGVYLLPRINKKLKTK